MILFSISSFFFFYFTVVGVYVIFMPKILQNLNYTSLQIGIIFAIAPLMRFIIPFLFLKLIKLTRNVFYIALLISIFSVSLFYVSIENFYLFAIPNLIFGGSLGLILPYIETYAMEHLKKERFGRSRLFGSIGFMLIGIVLAKHLENYENGLHFLLGGIVLCAIFGILVTQNNPTLKAEAPKEDDIFLLSKAKYFWVSMFFMQVSFGAFYNFFTIYETDHGISLEIVSYLWAFGVICEIALFYFQAPFLRNINLLSLMKIAVTMTIIRWLMLFCFPDNLFVSFASQSLHAFSFALHHTAAISFLYTLYANKKLATQFYYGFSFGLGGFVGALLAGYFYGPYLYLYASIVAGLSLWALFFKK
ncbi:MAG: MFS transporter [Sulfurospirillaceae bacterium]|nr:MFS transporter [Sulfurospirillaceae bacterium]